MAAYMIVLIEVTDSDGMEEYRTHVLPVIEQYGGRFLAAAPPDVLEGELQPQVTVILEFPSMERAHAWYDSADYQELKTLRQRSSRAVAVFVDGLPTL